MKRLLLSKEVIVSNNGDIRPYTDIILNYCTQSKIQVEMVAKEVPYLDITAVEKPAEHYDFVITTDESVLKKWRGIFVPPYDKEKTNKFADLAFAGRLLETIKERVVRNKSQDTTRPNIRRDNDKPDDPHKYAFNI